MPNEELDRGGYGAEEAQERCLYKDRGTDPDLDPSRSGAGLFMIE